MKKICFLLVLSIVSFFPISAQTEYKSTESNNLTESIKVNSDAAENRIESVRPISKNSETGSSAEEKIQVSADINTTIKSLLAGEKKSLGAFSTGNPEIDSYIKNFSAQYNIDPLLIYAQMYQESSFKQKATSHKGASGLMQLMPDTAKRFGVKNIYNPQQNIKAGIKYMRWLLDKFGGDMRLALAGYNAGEGAVKKHGNKVPPYRETQKYVARIMAHYEQITNQTSTPAGAANNKTSEAVARVF